MKLDNGMIVIMIAGVVVVVAVLWLASRPTKFLSANSFNEAKLIEKETVTHNTNRYRFSLPGGRVLGLPIGQHISFKYDDVNGKEVMRSYTPVTGDETVGYVDFVIKVYPEGKMSQHIDQLNINDTMLMRGPKGKFKYTPNMKGCIGMVAGGTGITPMYQVIKEILRNPGDKTTVSLVFGNVSLQDILLRSELDDLVRAHREQLYVHYVLDHAPEGWPGGTGYITADTLRQHCPAPAEDSMLLFCGPRVMTRALEASAAELGFSKGAYHTF